MGIFDSLNFDPQSYSDDGGMIGRLLQQLGVQGQYQPGAGFGQSPMDANAAVPQQQNAPIAVGDNYMMPRIGSGFAVPQIDPQTGETVAPQQQAAPQQAAPQQQPAQSVPMQAPQQQMPSFLQSQHSAGGFAGAMRGMIANAPLGPLGWIGGGIAGALGQGNGTLQEQQQRTMQQKYTGYINAGIEPKLAMLAVLDPKSAETILPQALSNKQKFVQMKDDMGAEHPAFIDETNQTVNGQPIAEYNKQHSAGTGALGDMNKTGAEYLASIPQKQRGTVQGMVEGTLPPPSSFALGKPYWQNMIAAAKQVDPTWDAANWSGRVAGMKSFKSGADAGTVRSANQVLGHISDLTDKADDLHNGDYPSLNWVGNKLAAGTGSDAPNNWVTQAHAVADELSSFMKGAGHSSDTEIRQWSDSLSPNMSPQQQRGAIKTLMGIYDHALQALEDKRTGAIGPVAAEKLGPLVTQAGQSAMDKVKKWAAGAAPQSTVAPLDVGQSTKVGNVSIKRVN